VAWVNAARQQLPASSGEIDCDNGQVRTSRPEAPLLFRIVKPLDSTAIHFVNAGAQCDGAPIGKDMDGFQLSRLHRGTTWLVCAVAYGQGREVAHANPTQMIRRSVILLGRWRRRVEDRNRLSGMSERQLFDIGLSRQDADWEIRKPFWRE